MRLYMAILIRCVEGAGSSYLILTALRTGIVTTREGMEAMGIWIWSGQT